MIKTTIVTPIPGMGVHELIIKEEPLPFEKSIAGYLDLWIEGKILEANMPDKDQEFLNLNFIRNTTRLKAMWEFIQKAKDICGLEPPENFQHWFGPDGTPRRIQDELLINEGEDNCSK